MKAIAVALGWGKQYSGSADFRDIFDTMHAAVESFPPELLERGREYLFPQLHNACVNGDLDVVEALLQHEGIAPDTYPCTEDENDEPPLVWLAQEPDMDTELKIRVAKALLANGADIDEGGALEHAREAGDEVFEEFLRKQGAT